MRKSRIVPLLGLLLVLLAVANTAAAASNKNFRTHLSGDEEVPVRVTNAQGQAKFKLNKEGTELSYKLNVANIENVLMAHIHQAAPGVNGDIVVWLYPSAPPGVQIPGRTSGTLAEGVITAANLTGPMAGQPLSALIQAINDGNAYVNVHTNDGVDPPNTGPGDFPGGEIRGQLHDH